MLKTFLLNETGQVISQPMVSTWMLPNERFPVIDWVCGNENKLAPTPVTVDFRTIDTIPEEWLVGVDE